jgi:hypothetical protein
VIFVLKGKCRIYWEVKKYRERHATIYADDETQDSDNPDIQEKLFSTQTAQPSNAPKWETDAHRKRPKALEIEEVSVELK